LQGWLASAKQKEWWEKNAPDPLYKNDYIWALIMHSFSWSFMIMLPIAVYNGFDICPMFVSMLLLNTALHATIDHMKANMKLINLWHDQIIHMVQILFTAFIFLVCA
jgi:hypothetical protein